jgi:hypothetical protein
LRVTRTFELWIEYPGFPETVLRYSGPDSDEAVRQGRDLKAQDLVKHWFVIEVRDTRTFHLHEIGQ